MTPVTPTTLAQWSHGHIVTRVRDGDIVHETIKGVSEYRLRPPSTGTGVVPPRRDEAEGRAHAEVPEGDYARCTGYFAVRINQTKKKGKTSEHKTTTQNPESHQEGTAAVLHG